MKAAQIDRYGTKNVVTINDIPSPQVSDGKILLEIHAASANPIDWKIRDGILKDVMPVQFPFTLGFDVSGVVLEVGAGVEHFKKGDEVYGQAGVFNGGSGSFAQIALADTSTLAPKPALLSDAEAASLPLTAVSAWQALVDHLDLKKGQKILIHGGAGGIGTFAIQIAKHLGAEVATTVGTKDREYARTLGADTVIDYKQEQFEQMLKEYDAVFDTAGGETYKKSFSVLRKGGMIVSMVEQPDQDLMKQHDVTALSQFTKVTAERLQKISDLTKQGVIKTHIDKTFPLNQAAEALEYLKTGHPAGKVVIQVTS